MKNPDNDWSLDDLEYLDVRISALEADVEEIISQLDKLSRESYKPKETNIG